MRGISRHIWQEGSLGSTSRPPERLQNQVPQAVLTAQPGWPAIWAPLLPPMEASQAALGSLLWVFSYFLSYAGWEEAGRGDGLCSVPIRPHLGTMSSLGSQTGLKCSLREEGLWGCGWFSMEQRIIWGTSQHTPVPMWTGSKGWGQALPNGVRLMVRLKDLRSLLQQKQLYDSVSETLVCIYLGEGHH